MTESAPSSRHGNGRELAGEVKALVFSSHVVNSSRVWGKYPFPRAQQLFPVYCFFFFFNFILFLNFT